jgi:hypothetical protein
VFRTLATTKNKKKKKKKKKQQQQHHGLDPTLLSFFHKLVIFGPIFDLKK